MKLRRLEETGISSVPNVIKYGTTLLYVGKQRSLWECLVQQWCLLPEANPRGSQWNIGVVFCVGCCDHSYTPHILYRL